MMQRVKKLGGALWLSISGASGRARRQLYHGRCGLRILTFHDTPPHLFDSFRRVVDAAREQFEMVGPESVAQVAAGQQISSDRDQTLLAFDDGFESNYAAAEYLSQNNIKAIFFIVPSFLDRTMEEYLKYHRSQSKSPFEFISDGSTHGLSRTQAREMADMGHLIAGHNFAHRDLSDLTTPQELEYEIDRAVDGVAEVTGKQCEDFAFGFGRPHNISQAAVDHLQSRCSRVYACVRGMNVPGLTPRLLLRDNVNLSEPLLFHRLCMRGGADLMWEPEVEALRKMGGTLPAGNHAAD